MFSFSESNISEIDPCCISNSSFSRYFAFEDLLPRASHVAPAVENPLANAGDFRDKSSPGLGRFPGGGHGNPLQYSCLENPMDGEAWQAAVHGVTKELNTIERLTLHFTSCHQYRDIMM